MSVIITTGSGYESIRTTIKYLRRQTAREGLEVIIISPALEWSPDIEAEFKDFYGTVLIETDIDTGLYDAWVTAVKRSNAPIVFFGENHAFPEPELAEAIIEAHKGPWAAVGCVIKNVNPDSVNSRAQLYMTYGAYTEPVESGEVNDLPGHNTSYKRSVLLDYGDELRGMLMRTNIMHMDLRARGFRLYLENKARTDHVNVSKTLAVIIDLFHNGRLYTAALARYKRWSIPERIFHALLEPLIISKHFLGTLHGIRRAGQSNELIPAALPIITLGLTAHFLGKITGYALGSGDAQKQINSYEFDRFRYITDQDIELISRL